MNNSTKKARAVFLDRDGVLNRVLLREHKPYAPRSLEDFEILPGVAEALERLKAAGFLLIVVTNQPDVVRGNTSRAQIDEMHHYLSTKLPLDAYYVCFHDDADACACRKPKPGSLLSAAQDYDIELADSYMIGDRWRDMEAGQKAGCKTGFIDYQYDEKQPLHYDFRATSLLQAADIILGECCEKS